MRRAGIVTLIVITVGALTFAGLVDFGQYLYPYGLLTVAYLVVGGFVAWKAEHNPVGRLLLLLAVLAGSGLGFRAVVAVTEDLVLAGWVDAVGNSLATAGILTIPVALLRFPDGRLLSRRWRWIEWATLLAGVLGAAAALLNGGWGGDISQAVAPSPLRGSTAPAGEVFSTIFYPAMGVVMVLPGVSLTLRYRRSEGDERLQMKWLVYAVALLVLTFLTMAIVSGNVAADEGWQEILVVVALSSVPVAMGTAVLKYRLYDIDIVINRTVVLALLAGFITGVYAVVVVLVGERIGGGSDGLALPIAATAVVAVAFEPVRHTAQRWANRLVYGRRATPYEVLSDLTSRLSKAEVGEGILTRLVSLLGDGTGAERAVVWLRTDGTMRPGAVWPADGDIEGEPDLGADHVFKVAHDGEIVGALEVVKPKGSALSTVDRALVSDLAGSAGALLGYQHLIDSLEIRARELVQSRARLVEAQDRERRRLERDLHDGAQQQIVGLKLKIALASRMAGDHGAESLVTLLDTLGEEAQGALEEIRSLAKGIYPPVLESDGLTPAVSSLAASAPVEVVLGCSGLGRYARDIEAAVYFDISEAVTNAVKHADPPIRIELAETGGRLRFTVSDDGPGFDPASVARGSGLANLHDRLDAIGGSLTIVSAPGHGTRVTGEVPVGALVV